MVKNYEDMLSRFQLIPERYGQTDRQMDGQTDGKDRIPISILHVSMLTRDKNDFQKSTCTVLLAVEPKH